MVVSRESLHSTSMDVGPPVVFSMGDTTPGWLLAPQKTKEYLRTTPPPQSVPGRKKGEVEFANAHQKWTSTEYKQPSNNNKPSNHYCCLLWFAYCKYKITPKPPRNTHKLVTPLLRGKRPPSYNTQFHMILRENLPQWPFQALKKPDRTHEPECSHFM